MEILGDEAQRKAIIEENQRGLTTIAQFMGRNALKNAMVLITGPDVVGKTTLARALGKSKIAGPVLDGDERTWHNIETRLAGKSRAKNCAIAAASHGENWGEPEQIAQLQARDRLMIVSLTADQPTRLENLYNRRFVGPQATDDLAKSEGQRRSEVQADIAASPDYVAERANVVLRWSEPYRPSVEQLNAFGQSIIVSEA